MEANFNVRKWEKTDEDPCKLINFYEKNKSVNTGVEMNYVISVQNKKVLGLYLNHEDIISLKTNEAFKEAINIILNKRNSLSVIASV